VIWRGLDARVDVGFFTGCFAALGAGRGGHQDGDGLTNTQEGLA
jgi:hypothetical protein